MMVPSGVERTTPRPSLLLFEAPSTYRVQTSEEQGDGVGTELFGVNSAMKSAITCPLTEVRDEKLIWYAPNSVAHFDILPVAWGFIRIVFRGYSVRTVMGKD